MEKTGIFDIPDEDERGVSPVIGVILMVAITVILAAVIASFVLGFGSSVSQNVNAGADISVNKANATGNADVTWISQGTADKLNITVTGDVTGNATLNNVGEVATISEDNTSSAVIKPTNDIGGGDHEVTIVIKAIKGETTTVVEKDTVTI
jgi:flagellin-like protein